MRHLGRLLIIAFCVWHMIATAIYVIPDESKNAPAKAIQAFIMPAAQPYLYATSQWQKWNIFSPDPIRRVSSYFFEIEKEGSWHPLLDVRPREIAWWKRSRELKVLRRTEEGGQAAAQAYLRYLCRIGLAPAGAHIRLRREYYVIPTGVEVRSMGGWQAFSPQTTTDILTDLYCLREQ